MRRGVGVCVWGGVRVHGHAQAVCGRRCNGVSLGHLAAAVDRPGRRVPGLQCRACRACRVMPPLKQRLLG